MTIRIANGPKATERGAEEAACKRSAAGGQVPYGAPRRSKLRCYQKPALGRFFHVPQKLLSILEFQRGDKFEVMEKDGGIFLCPVVVYPKEKLILMRQLTVKRQIL